MGEFLEAAAHFATAVGLPMAVVAGFAAVGSYRSARRAAADAHMHALFREYLLARLEITRSGWPAPLDASQGRLAGAAVPPASAAVAAVTDEADGKAEAHSEKSSGGQLAALKLYALEAMWDWIRRQDSRRMRKTPLVRLRRWHSHWDVLDAWKETIIVHLEQDDEEVLRSIEGFPQCYSLSFLKFAKESGVLDPARVQAAIEQRNEKKRVRGD